MKSNIINELYIEYRNLLFKIAFEIVKNKENAEDIVHQTFLKLVEGDLKIEGVKDIKTKSLLVIITKNLAINFYKKMKRVDLCCEKIDIEDNIQIEKIIISKQTVENICEILGELPAIYRDVLILEKVHGYNKYDIAKILEITIENVNKRSQRARQKFKNILKKGGNRNNEKYKI